MLRFANRIIVYYHFTNSINELKAKRSDENDQLATLVLWSIEVSKIWA